MPAESGAGLARRYAPDTELPLGAYALLVAAYVVLVAGGLVLLARLDAFPDAPPWGDLALVALATHKLARTVTRDWVTSPVRAPFTRHARNAGGGEFTDVSRGHGMRAAIGDLITCPYCIGPWIAGALVLALFALPAVTRVVLVVFAVVAVSDFLHETYEFLRAGRKRAAPSNE